MKHVIKIDKPYADAIAEGRKTFEVRINDRGYNAGDLVVFIVKDDGFTVLGHPIADKKYVITYVHSGLGMADRYVAFSIRAAGKEEEVGTE